jgi:hypothetical protein
VATKNDLKPIQRVFEARYERGYRYLDRCGDAMLILEEALPAVSDGHVWMPEEMQPKGARMKCPALDLTLVFDAYRFCLDQNPVDVDCRFEEISAYALDTVVSKFDIREFARLGARKVAIIPSDSIDQADDLSVQQIPLNGWITDDLGELTSRAHEAVIAFESDDRMEGIRLAMKPAAKIDAPQEIDRRLTIAPHLLDKGQREALLGQLKRQKLRHQDPLAGLIVDVDYWQAKPEDLKIEEFFIAAEKKIHALVESVRKGKK